MQGDVMQVRALKVSYSYPENLWSSGEIFCGPVRPFIREHAPNAIQDTPDASERPEQLHTRRRETGHLFGALPEAAW